MPLSLRFVVPLALALAAIAYAVVPLVDRFTFQWFVRDLDARGALIAKTSQDTLVELLREPRGAKQRVQRYFDRVLQGERVYALGFCDRGEARHFIADGNIELGGRLPLNTHGGQLGEAYIHGMNGIAEAVRQVRGTAVNQVPGDGPIVVTAGTGVPTSGLILATV